MTEWHLKFVVEPGEAELRFQHMRLTFQADPAVEVVEVSSNSSEPEAQTLIVRFKEGHDKPENRRLQHCDKVYGSVPITQKSRYQRLLDDNFFDD
jgi:hypothetical protein